MDKNAIKKYAIWARNELIARVTQKAEQYEITETKTTPKDSDSINGRLLTDVEKNQRKALIEKIQADGFEQVMEEVAYTWFNRFTALRFMEVNNYLPTHTRVFTNEAGEFKPQILADAIQLDLEGLDMDKVFELKDANKTEELYKYLLITQCNALSAILPRMFQKIEDYTELLLPDYLLREGSVIEQMIVLIPEADWTDQVQIIGWLYQYYNVEPKDKVFADLKKKIKVTKETLPAATQLFTPNWIVRYMVENSLGRLWLEAHPDNSLKDIWNYYIEDGAESFKHESRELRPEEIRCIDPCSGSGHILCYIFDVLVKIYENYGYSAREAVTSIIQNNLYGLDVDNRATQLAYFSVMMKARQYDRRFFSRDIQPNIYCIVESNGISKEVIEAFANGNSVLKKAIETIVVELKDSKEYGSILNISQQEWEQISERFDELNNKDKNVFEYQAYDDLLPLVQVARVLSNKYDVVITNPPYMGSSSMGSALADYVKKNYKVFGGDLFAVFVERNSNWIKKDGYVAMITQHTWMFTSSYEEMRKAILSKMHIKSLVHLGAHAFEEINGEVVQTVAFILSKGTAHKAKEKYIRLVDYGNQDSKEEAFLAHKKETEYLASEENFEFISGHSFAYWASEQVCKIYKEAKRISDYGAPKQGLATGANDVFLRAWFEVDINGVNFTATSNEDAERSKCKWFPYNKGGENKKWYGNNFYVVNWEHDGFEIKHFTDAKGKLRSRPQNLQYFFKPCCTWSLTSSGDFGARLKEPGFIFDINGMSLFTDEAIRLYMLGYLCSTVCAEFMKIGNPSLASQSGDIAKLPFVLDKTRVPEVTNIVEDICRQSKEDFDEREISWNFKRNPLI